MKDSLNNWSNIPDELIKSYIVIFIRFLIKIKKKFEGYSAHQTCAISKLADWFLQSAPLPPPSLIPPCGTLRPRRRLEQARQQMAAALQKHDAEFDRAVRLKEMDRAQADHALEQVGLVQTPRAKHKQWNAGKWEHLDFITISKYLSRDAPQNYDGSFWLLRWPANFLLEYIFFSCPHTTWRHPACHKKEKLKMPDIS